MPRRGSSRPREWKLRVSTLDVEDERDRAVVDQRHLHPRSEHPGLYRHTRGPESLAEPLVQRLGHLGPRRLREVRSSSLLASAIRDQRELTDDEHGAPGSENVTIELAIVADEDSQTRHLRSEPVRIGGRVFARNAEQYEEAATDLADDFFVDRDVRLGDALTDRPHRAFIFADPSVSARRSLGNTRAPPPGWGLLPSTRWDRGYRPTARTSRTRLRRLCAG